MRFEAKWRLLAIVVLLAARPAWGQRPAAVQLPTVSYFGVATTVSVPDGGSGLLGGVSRAGRRQPVRRAAAAVWESFDRRRQQRLQRLRHRRDPRFRGDGRGPARRTVRLVRCASSPRRGRRRFVGRLGGQLAVQDRSSRLGGRSRRGGAGGGGPANCHAAHPRERGGRFLSSCVVRRKRTARRASPAFTIRWPLAAPRAS